MSIDVDDNLIDRDCHIIVDGELEVRKIVKWIDVGRSRRIHGAEMLLEK